MTDLNLVQCTQIWSFHRKAVHLHVQHNSKMYQATMIAMTPLCPKLCCWFFLCLCGCCHSDDCFPSFQPILYPHPFPNKTKREREKQEQTNKQKRAIIVTNAYPSTIKWFLPVEMFCTWKSKCLYTLPFSMLPCFVQCYPAMSNVTLPCYN